METKQIKVYSFDELSEEVKNKVIIAMQEGEEFYFLEDCLKDDLKQELKNNKITPLKEPILNYSLNYCQGDGLKFTGVFKWRQYQVFINDGHLSNLYQHSYTTDINLETLKGNEVKEKTEEEFKNLYHSICKDLEKIGYAYIEDALSEDSIKEQIELNEYIFFENGKIANNYF